MTEKPKPLVSPGVDISGLDGFFLDVQRLFSSELWALSTGDEFKAAVALWGRAWQQIPPGSLPNDERVLSSFSGAGKAWKRVRDMALRGFIECSDGRLYHKTLCEDVLKAHQKRQAFRQRTEAANARWGHTEESRPDRSKSQKNRRSERMSSARSLGRHTEQEWASLVEYCERRCVKCSSEDRLVKDHITPVYRGGSDAIANLQPLCASCNSRKGADQTDYRPSGWEDAIEKAAKMPARMPDGGVFDACETPLQGRRRIQGQSSLRSDRAGARSANELFELLAAAANGNLDRNSPATEVVGPIDDLISLGCDLERHILPTVRRCVPTLDQPLRTWGARWLRQEILAAKAADSNPSKPNEPRIDFGNGYSAPYGTIHNLWSKGNWLVEWGPLPGEEGCRIPPDVLAEIMKAPVDA